MIILDTNVLSALMRRQPEPAVVRWLDHQPADAVWLTAVTVFEIRSGLALLEAGKRRQALESAFTRMLAEDFSNRVCDVDTASAEAAGTLAAARQRAGRLVDLRDTLIAGIARVRRATIATHNTRHFADLAVPVVDPWTA